MGAKKIRARRAPTTTTTTASITKEQFVAGVRAIPDEWVTDVSVAIRARIEEFREKHHEAWDQHEAERAAAAEGAMLGA